MLKIIYGDEAEPFHWEPLRWTQFEREFQRHNELGE